MFDTSPQMIVCDGTSTKSRFLQVLLIACGIDANNMIIIYAWALVENETDAAWSYFLNHLTTAMPEITFPGITFMSDRDKGLATASDRHLPDADRASCYLSDE